MNSIRKLNNCEKTILTTLLVTFCIRASTSECWTEEDKETCTLTITCDGLSQVQDYDVYYRTYQYDGDQERYKVDITFELNLTPFEIHELITWEDQFLSRFNNRELNSLSLRNYTLSVTPLIRTPTQLIINHIDLSHNSITKFDLNSLHNVQNLESFNLSHNYISDLKKPVDEPNNQFIKTLSVIDLSHNQIGHIEESSFSSFETITSLDLSQNNLSRIDFLCFRGLNNLISLNLSFNYLNEFDMALFDLRSLEYLDASFNQLATLYKQDFMMSTHLKKLNIQNNNLMSLDPQTFSTLINLEWLDMSHNYLKDFLDESLFKNNIKLVSVDFSVNDLSSLVRNAFSLQVLETFKVAGNMLSGVLVPDYFKGMSRVTILDLSHQYLTGVSNYAFTGLDSLEILNLSYNTISMIEHEAFAMLSNLISIDLSHNRITIIDFAHRGLVLLYSLRVDHNLITNITNNTFDNLNALEVLDISYNSIDHLCAKCLPLRSLRFLFLKNNAVSKMDPESFSSLSRVTELDISNFRLSKLLNNTFQGLKSVTELNISYNRIEIIEPSAFKGLVNLTTLDISTNLLDAFIVDTLDLTNLVTLKLGNNRLSTILSLSCFHSLQVLDLSSNKLKLPFDSFDSLPFLRVLKLSNNSLDEFVVPRLEALSYLDLASNNIHTIEYSSNRTTSLREIRLTSNKIQDIKLSNLAQNNFLQEIYLNENSIQDIDVLSFKGLKDLTILDLSDNLISVLVPGSFIELHHLHVLNISHNRIKEIKFGAFNGLNDLQIVDVSSNSLINIHFDIFFPLTSISNIILDHNKINNIEDVNRFAGPLTSVSLGGNPLDCRWLSSLLRSISYMRSFKIQALHNNFTGENLDGITCVHQDAQISTTVNNSEMQHDLRPHLANLTQSLKHILDTNISLSSSFSDVSLASFLKNHTNLLEKILNKNYSHTVEKAVHLDVYTKKHYDHVEAFMDAILRKLNGTNDFPNVSRFEKATVEHSEVNSEKFNGKPVKTDVMKNCKNYIVELMEMFQQKIFTESINIGDQSIGELVRNIRWCLEKIKVSADQVEPSREAGRSAESNHQLDPNNYAAHIKLTEACVFVILIIMLSVIAYKFYVFKVLSTSNRSQKQSEQNFQMN